MFALIVAALRKQCNKQTKGQSTGEIVKHGKPINTEKNVEITQTRWKPLPKNMPSPALYANFEFPSRNLVRFRHTQCSPQQLQNGHKWVYEVKRAKAARKFVTVILRDVRLGSV